MMRERGRQEALQGNIVRIIGPVVAVIVGRRRLELFSLICSSWSSLFTGRGGEMLCMVSDKADLHSHRFCLYVLPLSSIDNIGMSDNVFTLESLWKRSLPAE